MKGTQGLRQRDHISETPEGVLLNGETIGEGGFEEAVALLVKMRHVIRDDVQLEVEYDDGDPDDTTKFVVYQNNSGEVNVDEVDEFPSESEDPYDPDTDLSDTTFSSGVKDQDQSNPLLGQVKNPDELVPDKKPKNSSQGISRKLVALVAGILVLVLVVVGALFLLNHNKSSEASQDFSNTSTGTTSTDSVSTKLTNVVSKQSNKFSGTHPDDYNKKSWDYNVPDGAQMGSTSTALSYKTNKEVVLVDPDSGKDIRHEKIEHSVETILDAKVDGKPSVVWQDGDWVRTWYPDLGEKGPISSYKVPDNTSISNTGELVMASGENKAYSLTGDGFSEYKVPDGSIPLSLDEAGLISSEGQQGPIRVSDKDGNGDSHVIEPPEGMKYIKKWVSSGYGKVVVVWSSSASDPDDQTDVVLSVNDAKTGKVLSSFGTTYGEVGKDASWVRGAGRSLAMISNRVFSLNSGKIVFDATSVNGVVSDIKGDFIVGSDNKGNFVAKYQGDDSTAWRGKMPLLGTTNANNVIVEEKGNNLAKYTSSDAILS